jgi:hypothetical protein
MPENAEIFERLIQDHNVHRDLFARLQEIDGETPERRKLFTQLTKELKSHASAEEQALYSTMMRKPETTDETRHSVAEHHDIEVALNDLAATEMTSSEWDEKFDQLRDRYLHHIEEEEDEHFPDFDNYLTAEDESHMRVVFERRKKAEREEAEVTPELKEDAKE